MSGNAYSLFKSSHPPFSGPSGQACGARKSWIRLGNPLWHLIASIEEPTVIKIKIVILMKIIILTVKFKQVLTKFIIF